MTKHDTVVLECRNLILELGNQKSSLFQDASLAKSYFQLPWWYEFNFWSTCKMIRLTNFEKIVHVKPNQIRLKKDKKISSSKNQFQTSFLKHLTIQILITLKKLRMKHWTNFLNKPTSMVKYKVLGNVFLTFCSMDSASPLVQLNQKFLCRKSLLDSTT